jgi:tRNA (guanine37-N1)-methyltransferase
MKISVVTLFPEMFKALSEYGISGRAFKHGLVQLTFSNPREFAEDRHRSVDDRPYGGGPGMLIKTEPVTAAIKAAREQLGSGAKKAPVIYLSPQGRPLVQKDLARLANEASLVLLCGRYEGIDERVISSLVDEEVSLGDYVISGGELAAMVLMDGIIRLKPEALGHEDSALEDSFVAGLLDCPHFTRPEEFAGMKVPEVLLSGDHAAIARWRMKQSLGRTWQRRPELLQELELNAEQQALLDEFISENKNC